MSPETPLQSLLQVLEARLNESTGRNITIEEVDLYGLMGPERHAAIDALVAGGETPLLMVAGTVVCAGELDVIALGEALTTGPGHAPTGEETT